MAGLSPSTEGHREAKVPFQLGGRSHPQPKATDRLDGGILYSSAPRRGQSHSLGMVIFGLLVSGMPLGRLPNKTAVGISALL